MEFALVMLAANVLFNVLVWPPFLRRIKNDPRAHDESGKATKFLTVHYVLIGSALLVAAVSLLALLLAVL